MVGTSINFKPVLKITTVAIMCTMKNISFLTIILALILASCGTANISTGDDMYRLSEPIVVSGDKDDENSYANYVDEKRSGNAEDVEYYNPNYSGATNYYFIQPGYNYRPTFSNNFYRNNWNNNYYDWNYWNNPYNEFYGNSWGNNYYHGSYWGNPYNNYYANNWNNNYYGWSYGYNPYCYSNGWNNGWNNGGYYNGYYGSSYEPNYNNHTNGTFQSGSYSQKKRNQISSSSVRSSSYASSLKNASVNSNKHFKPKTTGRTYSGSSFTNNQPKEQSVSSRTKVEKTTGYNSIAKPVSSRENAAQRSNNKGYTKPSSKNRTNYSNSSQSTSAGKPIRYNSSSGRSSTFSGNSSKGSNSSTSPSRSNSSSGRSYSRSSSSKSSKSSSKSSSSSSSKKGGRR